MQKAAKEKSSLLWLIALAMSLCAPSYASSTRDLPPENRAEIFLPDGQNRIEPPALSPTTAASYYDSTSEVASGSSVAPIRAGSGVSKGALKQFKQTIRNLSKPESTGLSQQKLDQLRRMSDRTGGRVRVDLDGVKGTGVRPHAHVEGLGSRVESRHIWLQEGVK